MMARDQKYTVVKSHSFDQTIFDVFPGDNTAGFDAWTAAVRSKDSVEFEISLKLSGGRRPLHWKGSITK